MLLMLFLLCLVVLLLVWWVVLLFSASDLTIRNRYRAAKIGIISLFIGVTSFLLGRKFEQSEKELMEELEGQRNFNFSEKSINKIVKYMEESK